jgi:ABC-type hemin transport system ATPase subunit
VLLHAGAVLADGAPELVLRPDLLSRAYGTTLEVIRAADGRRAVMLPSHQERA